MSDKYPTAEAKQVEKAKKEVDKEVAEAQKKDDEEIETLQKSCEATLVEHGGMESNIGIGDGYWTNQNRLRFLRNRKGV